MFHQPFSAQCCISIPLEKSENQRFSNVYKGYRNGTLTWNGLKEEAIGIGLVTMTFIQYSERFKCTYLRYAIQFSFKLRHANERLFTSNHVSSAISNKFDEW